MTRVNYVEDEDRPGQFNLWHANIARSIAGRRGQTALVELEQAMIAMPDKRLIARHLVKDGEVCAVGSLALARRVADGATREAALAELAERYAPACDCIHVKHPDHDNGPCARCATLVAEQADLPPTHRWATICAGYHTGAYVEDGFDEEDEEGLVEDVAVGLGVPRLMAWKLAVLSDIDLAAVTPEERYRQVLAWIQGQRAKTTSVAATQI